MAGKWGAGENVFIWGEERVGGMTVRVHRVRREGVYTS